MPKGLNLKNFGRRKSSGTVLDFEPAEANSAPAQTTFRVLERPGKTSSTHGAQERVRNINSPLNALRGKSENDLGLGPNRGSRGTTNSGSSGYYDSSSASARHSSTSTLPSSLDQDRVPDEEELFQPVRKSVTTGMYRTNAASTEEPPPPPPSFTTRAARALSFGQKHGSKNSSKDVPPPPPPHNPAHYPPIPPLRSHSPSRDRSMTTSSYASTAVPPKTELSLSPDFGNDDFSNMFDTLKKDQTNQPYPPPRAESIGAFHRTDSEPMYPPRTLSRNALTPSPNHLAFAREETESPYYSDDRSENDGLVSSSALSSPNTIDGNAPGPAVGNGIAQAFLGNSKSGYSRVPERYGSPGPPQRSDSVDSYSSATGNNNGKDKEPAYVNRQTHLEDEDRWVRRVELSDAPMPSPVPARATPATNTASRQPSKTMQASAGASRPRASIPMSSAEESFLTESNMTTPRAARMDIKNVSDNTGYDSSPIGPVSRAIRPSSHQRTESGGLKKMTKAQFQALQRRNESHSDQSEEEDLSGDDYDAEDDIERAKQMARQRRKQEANMSVYRQQMKKVTGGGPTDLPSSGASTVRPSMDRGSTAPAATGGIHFGGIGGTPPADSIHGKPDEDEDEDVPLGILQAHGFPSSSRPPTRVGENDINHSRRTSTGGSVLNGGAGQGNLPPFARRLPADPYFGAGLVNQQTRESLAMNSSGASVVGMPTGPMQPQPSPMGHPGGLVGVIAGEERARAARRGSPNTANMMGSGMPLPPNVNMPPSMPRTMSMGNLAPPSVYGGAPPMPMMPQMPGMGQMGMPQIGAPQMPQQPMDASQQQLQQFMSMQMQLMQNMMAMQQAQMGQTPQSPQLQAQGMQQQPGDYLGVNFGNNMQRPMSMASQNSFQQGPVPPQGRSMTMMNPPTGWTQPPQSGGLRPNSAMPMAPGSYAPSVAGLNIGGGGPGPGYTPSIAPSERSNIGMPSRYRPVTQNGETSSRTQSMTSSLTLQAFTNQQNAPKPGTPFNASQAQTPKSTIRIVDKPKGAPKFASRQVEDDEDDGWADMKKKREEKKKSKWSRKDKTASSSTAGPSLSELYQGLD